VPLFSPIRATCSAHLILLDFITGTILDEGYRSLNSSLHSFLYFPLTSSPLNPQTHRKCLNQFDIFVTILYLMPSLYCVVQQTCGKIRIATGIFSSVHMGYIVLHIEMQTAVK
jgi:hypothetical protein